MKPLYSLFCLALATSGSNAQTVLTPAQYDVLKSVGQLPVDAVVITGPVSPDAFTPGGSAKSGPCDCWVEPDSSYSLAMYDNDDASTGLISIPFTFNLLGAQYDSLYINNNGNISFSSPYGTFSASPFPDPTYVMVAPFWADVDTRDTTMADTTDHANGVVLYKITPTAVYVNWVDVGYYAMQWDKRNTFQLIITDGTDPVIPGGNNVSFCYKDMQWTTGAASGGLNGFGGVSATAGVNAGNGIDHTQIGRFGWDNDVYSGAYADTSGVHWLDSTHFYMNTAGSGVPPVIGSTFNCDTVIVQFSSGGERSQSIMRRLIVTPGGPGQQVSCVSSAPTLPNFAQVNEGPAEFVDLTFEIDATGALPGTHYITFTASNDAPTPLVSEYVLQVEVSAITGVMSGSATEPVLTVSPNPATDAVWVQWAGSTAPDGFSILAADGRVVLAIRSLQDGTSQLLNIQSLTPGTYTLVAEFAQGRRVQHLLKVSQ